MPGILVFTLIVIVVVIVLLFLHDARKAQAGSLPNVPPRAPHAPPKASRTQPAAAPPPEDLLASADVEGLVEHVRELRRAVDEGLIGRDEAVASIVRQAGGLVGDQAAEQLLDASERD